MPPNQAGSSSKPVLDSANESPTRASASRHLRRIAATPRVQFSPIYRAIAAGGMGSGCLRYFTSGLFAISNAITTDCAFSSAPSALVCVWSIGNSSFAFSCPVAPIGLPPRYPYRHTGGASRPRYSSSRHRSLTHAGGEAPGRVRPPLVDNRHREEHRGRALCFDLVDVLAVVPTVGMNCLGLAGHGSEGLGNVLGRVAISAKVATRFVPAQVAPSLWPTATSRNRPLNFRQGLVPQSLIHVGTCAPARGERFRDIDLFGVEVVRRWSPSPDPRRCGRSSRQR